MEYFDLFKSNTMDFTKYFKDRDIKLDYYQPTVVQMKELFSVKDWKSVLQEEWVIDHIVPQDSRLDKLSYAVYGHTKFWWIFLLMNDVQNPFGWILSDTEIYELAELLYAEYNIYSLRCYQELLFDYYNNKRNIQIIDPAYLTNFLTAMEKYRDE